MVSTKFLPAFVFVAFSGALLGGCGGSGSDTSTPSDSSAVKTSTTPASPATPTTPTTPTTPAPTTSSTANVTWTPTAEDPGATAQLAGYHIYYGTSADSMTQVADVPGAGSVSDVIANLPPGTWYFGVASYDTNSVESDLSEVVAVDLS